MFITLAACQRGLLLAFRGGTALHVCGEISVKFHHVITVVRV